jgi:hypothetical protein
MRLYLAHNPTPALMLKAIPRPTHRPLVLSKGYGHDDEWLRDFEGTELFAEAVKLCERELDLKLKQAERRLVVEPISPRKESHYDKMERIRLEKKKLGLQLAKKRHAQRKQMDAAMTKAKGQQDLGPIIEALTDDMPGEELKKK